MHQEQKIQPSLSNKKGRQSQLFAIDCLFSVFSVQLIPNGRWKLEDESFSFWVQPKWKSNLLYSAYAVSTFSFLLCLQLGFFYIASVPSVNWFSSVESEDGGLGLLIIRENP